MANTARRTRHVGSVDNWQTGKTLAQCNLRMLTSETSYDVTFLVGGDCQIVNAHRYVLISRSCVFAAILPEVLKDDADMAIPDIEPEDFHSFLVYLYTDDTEIGPRNATSLLYAARKYGVGGLEDKCVKYLKGNMTPKNACVILEAAFRSDQTKLYGKALKVILNNGDECLKTPGFLALSQKCVEQIVKSDDLIADETVVFESVNSWAESECRRQEKAPTPRNKRDVMGDALKAIRFTLMKSKYFVDNVGNSGLLADDERLKIFVHNLFPERSISPFNKNQRRKDRGSSKGSSRSRGSLSHRESGSRSQMESLDSRQTLSGAKTHRGFGGYSTHRGFGGDSREYENNEDRVQMEWREDTPLADDHARKKKKKKKKQKKRVYNRTENRFRIQSFGRECKGREWEPMKFRTREEIELCGFLMYGPCDDDVATYDVEANLVDDFDEIVDGTNVDSRYVARKEDVYFEVTFPEPVILTPRKWYTLNVLISGPPSMYGSDVKDRVVSHGVTFEFHHTDTHAYRSDQSQVPYLLFRNNY